MEKINFGDSEQNDIELVRRLVLRRLREDKAWTQAESKSHYVIGFEQYVDFTSEAHRERFFELADTVLWQLVTLGVILPGKGGGGWVEHFGLPYFRITDYGHEVIDAGRTSPHDPSGYLSELRKSAKTLATPIMLGYLEEALQCFTRGCNTASVLLLGVSAEAAFLELCSTVALSLQDPNERGRFENMDGVKRKHRWMVQRYEQLPAGDKRNRLPDGLDITLTGIYDLIRRQRNELGHPQLSSPNVDREHAFAHFRLFHTFLLDAEAFAEFCRTNGI
jgi:hypothetical protein